MPDTHIDLELVGFTTIYDLVPAGSRPYEFQGHTVPDLIRSLADRYGERAKKALLDEKLAGIDPTIQVKVNKSYVKPEELSHFALNENDRVTLFKLLAGG